MARRRKAQADVPAPATIAGGDDMRYRARSALHTLAEADEIKSNKPLMREVKKLHTRQGKALGVKKRAKKEAY